MSRQQRRARSIPRPNKLGWTEFKLVATRPDGSEQFENSNYWVLRQELSDGWTTLGIRAKHGGPIRNWNDLQRVKNELAGPEREAVELFPAESRLVDVLNENHLWVSPAGNRFQHGFERRFVRVERPGETGPQGSDLDLAWKDDARVDVPEPKSYPTSRCGSHVARG